MRPRTARPLASRLAFAFLWIFIFSMPLEKAIEIEGIGSGSKVVGFVAVGMGLLAIAINGRFRIPGRIQIALALLVLWSAATLRWSMSEDLTVERTITEVQLLSLVILIWEFCPEEGDVLSLMGAYVLATFIPAVDTLQRFLLGQQTYYNRYATAGFDPNDMALTIALSLPISYYLSLKKTGPMRWLCRLQILASIGTIFLTASRGGTFCMLIALSLILTTLRTLPMRQRVAVVALGALSAVGAVALVPSTTWTRLGTAASEVSEGTANGRTILWKAGFTAFQYVPFGGVGAGAYPETSAKFIGRPRTFVPVAHNSFISVLVETGVIGFTILAGMLFMLLRLAMQMPAIARSFWLTTLCVWTIGVCSLTWEFRKPTWFVFGLLAAHAASLPQAAAAVEPAFRRRQYLGTTSVPSGASY